MTGWEVLATSPLLSALALVILYLIGTTIHNIFFNPLNKYPGPKIASVSRIPLTYAFLCGRAPHWLRRQHEKYGSIVRIAPDELSYIAAEAWKDINGPTTAFRYGQKRSEDFFAYFFNKQSTKESIVTANDDDHRRLRKIFARAFSKQALTVQEPLITQKVDALIEKLGKASQAGNTVNMVDLHCLTVFDIMADLILGETLNLLVDDSPHAGWVRSVPAYLATSFFLAALAKFSIIRFFLSYFALPLLTPQYKYFQKIMGHKVDVRLSVKGGRGDIVHFLTDLKEGTPLSRPELENAVLILMAAGSDTTPSIICGLNYLLLAHPVVLAKAVEEIRSAFKSDKDMTWDAVFKLEYLGACIDEAFRVYPPTTTGFPRQVTSMSGAWICGKFVPGGTTVCVSPFAAYHSPSNFHNPDHFIPERWLQQAEAKYANDKKAVVQPFSTGPRDCVGRMVANFIIRVIICRMLWNFDFVLEPGQENWARQRAYGNWQRTPLVVKVYSVNRD
ncbi:cytochrome P450 [Stipitochalara longipes BDJ]|nr:cytochrome P450 [Stipitochalara longipes BDJ]